MSVIGEIIGELCTSAPLLAGSVWTSPQVQLGQWNSLSVVIYTDTNCIFKAHWAAAGIYYDYTETTNITSGVPIQIPIITVDKWVYFTLYNLTGANQTTLRLNTYGTVTNNAVQVTFPSGTQVSIEGPPNEDLISNLVIVKANPFPGTQLNFQQIYSQSQTTFTAADPVNSILPNMSYVVTDPTISYYSTDVNKLSLAGFNASVAGDIGKLSRFYSNCVTPTIPDETLLVSFTSLFKDTSPKANVYLSDEQIGFGMPADYTGSTTTWFSGFSVGKGAPVAWGTGYTKFRVALWANSNPTYVTQNNFNLDVLDGTGVSGMVLDITKMNNYRITIRLGGTVQILFSVLNPSSHQFVNFHYITDANKIISPEFILGGRLIIDSVCQAASSSVGTAGSGTTSYATYVDSGYKPRPTIPVAYGTSVSTSTAETFVALIQNFETFQSRRVAIPVILDEISFSADSTSSLIVRIYKANTYSASAFTAITPYFSPLQVSTAGTTISTYGYIAGQYTVGGNGSLSKSIEGLVVNPGENIVITGQLKTGSSSNCNYAGRFSQYF